MILTNFLMAYMFLLLLFVSLFRDEMGFFCLRMAATFIEEPEFLADVDIDLAFYIQSSLRNKYKGSIEMNASIFASGLLLFLPAVILCTIFAAIYLFLYNKDK